MANIIDLRETSPGHWQAKYQGNYGIYTICITISEGKITGFSCSCPSSRYPCKHIAMIENAIAERIAKNKKTGGNKATDAEEILKTLSREELYKFIVRLIRYRYNADLTNAVMLEFSHKIESPHQNKYSLVLRQALEKVKLDEDYYGEDWISIDVLDQWLEKARDYLNQRNYHEAVLAAQACIEEFAYWQENSDSDISELVYDGYQSEPFEVLTGAARSQEVNIRELFDYCMKEMPKKKYAGTMAYDNFNDLLLELLKAGKEELNAGAFISLQNSLLESVTDKSSYEAQKILQREIDYYKSRHKYKKAWEIIEENIQIVAFRRMLVEKKIEQRDYDAAKKLIYDFVNADPKRERHPSEWDDFLLTIAKEEKDTPALRKISRICIDDYFRADYFPLYKSTFTDGEWAEAMEDLITYYKNKTRGFSSSVADVLTAGNVAERLLEYIEKYPFIENLDKYYTVFAKAFPEKTLALFRKSVDRYAESNTGRTSYEHIAELLRKMTEIPNGGAVVTGMINEYRTRYKIRRAMVEVLDRVQKNLDLLRTDPRSSFV